MPVGIEKAPESTEVSWTAIPLPDILPVMSMPLASSTLVVIVGLALLTVRVSPFAPHAAVKGLLFESPVYDACQL